MFAITKRELSDRNQKRQKDKGYSNIPKGATVYIIDGYIGKYVPVIYESNSYTICSKDLVWRKANHA